VDVLLSGVGGRRVMEGWMFLLKRQYGGKKNLRQ